MQHCLHDVSSLYYDFRQLLTATKQILQNQFSWGVLLLLQVLYRVYIFQPSRSKSAFLEVWYCQWSTRAP